MRLDEHDTKPSPENEQKLKDLRRRIDEDVSTAHSEFAQKILNNPTLVQPETLKYVIATFDIHAHYWHFVVFTDSGLANYLSYLKDLATEAEALAKKMTQSWPTIMAMEFSRTVHSWLVGRTSHWKSVAIKRVREFENAERETTSPIKQPASASAAVPPSLEKKARHFLEPNLSLLKNEEATLMRKQAAEALGVTERTLDRWVEKDKLSPVGPRKRFKTKDLLRLLNKKTRDKVDKSGQE